MKCVRVGTLVLLLIDAVSPLALAQRAFSSPPPDTDTVSTCYPFEITLGLPWYMVDRTEVSSR